MSAHLQCSLSTGPSDWLHRLALCLCETASSKTSEAKICRCFYNVHHSTLNSQRPREGGITSPVLRMQELRQRKQFACGLTVSEGWNRSPGIWALLPNVPANWLSHSGLISVWKACAWVRLHLMGGREEPRMWSQQGPLCLWCRGRVARSCREASEEGWFEVNLSVERAWST